MKLQARALNLTYRNLTDRIPAVPRFRLNFRAFADLRRLLLDRDVIARGACSRFACRLALHLPEIAARIDEADFGVLHLEVGEMKLATHDAILGEDWGAVMLHFAFTTHFFVNAGDELRDAIRVSYLGNLFYGETSASHAKARCLLPRPLAIALQQVEQHYEQLIP